MKPSIYIETTVVSYLTAKLSKDLIVAAHQQITHEWWENSLNHFVPYISPVVLDEASKGDKEAAQLRLEKIKNFTILKVNSDINQLSEIYYSSLSIPEKTKADTYHLAIASWYNIDFLVTWNCSHIANGFIIKELKKINFNLGVNTPEICTPEELMEVLSER
ncbi:MAG: type II toxin-antitoxin system VapC family toxin [Candidatus Aminicenantes bacterium]|nr:MAG: type II toxin-antitoxin system VapC family toxin [Candidatus Aminicenantes bacterium]